MRMDKLTLKAQEAVSNAQNIATENNHHEILPEHLLKSLAGQDGGIFSSIAQKIGASVLDDVCMYIYCYPDIEERVYVECHVS